MRSDLLFMLKLVSTSRKQLFFIFSCLLGFVAALMEGVSYSFLLLAFSAILEEPLVTFLPLNFLKEHLEGQLFILFILLGVLSQLLKSGLCFLSSVMIASMGMRLQRDVQLEIHDRIFNLKYEKSSRYQLGELSETLKAPMLFFRPFLEQAGQLFISLCIIFVSLSFMVLLSLPLTLFTLFLFIVGGVMQKAIVKKSGSSSLLLHEQLERFSSVAFQSLQCLKLIHLYQAQGWVKNKMKGHLEKFEHFSKKMLLSSGLIACLNEVLGIILVSVSLLVGYMILNWESKAVLPILLGFMTVTYRLSGKILGVMNGLHQMAILRGPFEQMKRVLNQQEEKESNKKRLRFEDQMQFRHLSFCYPGTEQRVINDLTFTLKKGQMVVLVGASGAGKSTLLDLVAGLYFPSQGEILVDGISLQEGDLHLWRKKLGVVSQEIHLFHETIEENIRFGNPCVTQDQVVEAAKSAFCHDFILKLPQGYQTMIGDGNLALSGGERQRISLARALVRHPEILLLDEVTNHLDADSEEWICAFIQAQKGKKTILLISHHLRLSLPADHIVMIEGGKIVEQGDHCQLVQKEGLYHKIWNLQNRVYHAQKDLR